MSPSHSTLLYLSPRTTIFWWSSLLSPRTTIFWRHLQGRPYSGDQAWIKPNIQHQVLLHHRLFKICLDPAKDSWWWKVLRLTSTQVGVYLAISYLPGHFYLSTWPILLIYLAIFRIYLASPSEDTATPTTAHSSQKEVPPLQYNTVPGPAGHSTTTTIQVPGHAGYTTFYKLLLAFSQ